MGRDSDTDGGPSPSPFNNAQLEEEAFAAQNQRTLASQVQALRRIFDHGGKDAKAAKGDEASPSNPSSPHLPPPPIPQPHLLQGDFGLPGDEGQPTIATRARLQETKSMVHRELHDFPPPPPWTEQITLRSILMGTLLGTGFALVMMKLSLTAGMVPGMSMPSTLLGFCLLTGWNKLMGRLGFKVRPFTPQENTMMQTFAGSVVGAAIGGGFGSYLTAMDQQSYENLAGTPGNRPEDVFNPYLGRIIPYHIAVGFVGCFLLVQLRKPFILDYELPFPSATAGAVLINSLHDAGGEADADAQVAVLGKWGIWSFVFTSFKWFFSSSDGPGCSGGFDRFPSFGLKALEWNINFDFNQSYIGVGMICPHLVNVSMLLGAIFSWGFLWPQIQRQEGHWFPVGLGAKSFSGLFGYKVFLALAVFMGDGLYNLVKVTILSTRAFMAKRKVATQLPKCDTAKDAVMTDQRAKKSFSSRPSLARLLGSFNLTSSQRFDISASSVGAPPADSIAASLKKDADRDVSSSDESIPSSASSSSGEADDELAALIKHRNAVFLKDSIPDWLGWAGYFFFAALGAVIIPQVYPAVKWFYVVVAYLATPAICYVNAFVCGLTDNDLSSMYGKLFIFVFASWAGAANGGVIVGLAICGVVLSTVGSTAGMMSDFKSSWITLTSPRAMFAAQIIGTCIGVAIGPSIFFMFYRMFPIGDPNGKFPAPYATIYRAMAILGTQGLKALPGHCVELFGGFFFAAILVSFVRDMVPEKVSRFIPLPSAFAIPFYLGPSFAVDMFLGTLIKWRWERTNPKGAETFVIPAAAGLIVGDGIVALPSNLLALLKVEPPICMKFVAKGAPATARHLLSMVLNR